jgi:hypothetical protein
MHPSSFLHHKRHPGILEKFANAMSIGFLNIQDPGLFESMISWVLDSRFVLSGMTLMKTYSLIHQKE